MGGAISRPSSRTVPPYIDQHVVSEPVSVRNSEIAADLALARKRIEVLEAEVAKTNKILLEKDATLRQYELKQHESQQVQFSGQDLKLSDIHQSVSDGVLDFDEEKEDEEVFRLFFSEIDKDKSDSIEKSELLEVLENYKGQSELVDAFEALLGQADSSRLDFESFQKIARKVPRVSGQRIQWAKSLRLDAALAQQLRAGAIFDGMLGVKQMSEQDIRSACTKFSEIATHIVMNGWKVLNLSLPLINAAEEANSKFSMTGVCTTPEWEWSWVLDPDIVPSSFRTRQLEREGTFPGEVGDFYSHLDVYVHVGLEAADSAKAVQDNLNSNLASVLTKTFLESSEEVARGIRVVQEAHMSGDAVNMCVSIPLEKENFVEVRMEVFRQAARQAVVVPVRDIVLTEILEKSVQYFEHVDEKSFQRSLLTKLKVSTPEAWNEFVHTNYASDTKGSLSPDQCIELILKKFNEESELLRRRRTVRKLGRVRGGKITDFIQEPHVRDVIFRAKLIKEEVIALRLYTGPMYLLFNAKLRNFPQQIVSSLLGNRYETTIFVISSGITKLSKVTKIPENRLLYRGLGGMLLPDQFWKPSAEDFAGGVEYGLMSTTTDKSIAISYSGIDKKRAIIFEITTGRIDIGGSLSFVSQYPGEEEYLIAPLSCLEVMGRPRVEATPRGEVVVFPMRVNVNGKGLTVEQLVQRRKNLHIAMATNLREELFQLLDEHVGEDRLKAKISDDRVGEARARHELAEAALAAARERLRAAEAELDPFMGVLEVLKGDPTHVTIDHESCVADFKGGLCSVGTPRSLATAGGVYYEIELLDLNEDSRPQLGFAGELLDRSRMGVGIGQDQVSWAVDGTRGMRMHGAYDVGARVMGLYKNGKWYPARITELNPGGVSDTYLLNWDDGDGQDRVKTAEQMQPIREDGVGASAVVTGGGHWEKWGSVWQEGDVIGVACDLDFGTMWVSVNGSIAAPDGLAFANGLVPGPTVGRGLFPSFSGQNMRVAYNFGADIAARPFRALPSLPAKSAETGHAVEVVRGDPNQAGVDPGRCEVEFRGLCAVGVPRLAASAGRVYYEIHLVRTRPDSRLQVGFAGQRISVTSLQIGIGSDRVSWAVDGMRRRRLHRGGWKPTLKVGQAVEGLYKNGRWYPARIAALDHGGSAGAFLLDWNDGDTQDRVKYAEHLRIPSGIDLSALSDSEDDNLDEDEEGGGADKYVESENWGAAWQEGDVIGVEVDLDRGVLMITVNGDASAGGVAFDEGVQPGQRVGRSIFPAFSGSDVTVIYNFGLDPAKPLRFSPEGYISKAADAHNFKPEKFLPAREALPDVFAAAKAQADEAKAALDAAETAAADTRTVHVAVVLDSEVPVVAENIRREYESMFDRQASLAADEYNVEATYKALMNEAIDAKVFALRKLHFFVTSVQSGEACRDSDMRLRIRDAPFPDFAADGIELALRTGVKSFPWGDISRGSPTLDLGDWSPKSCAEWELEKIRRVLQDCHGVRGLCLSGGLVSFPQGLFAADLNLSFQPILGVEEAIGFMLTTNSRLTSLSIRGNRLGAEEVDKLLTWVVDPVGRVNAACAVLTILNGQRWSWDLIAGGLTSLDLSLQGLGQDDAAVIGALLSRSATTLTVLNLSSNLWEHEGATSLAYGLRRLSALTQLDLSNATLTAQDWMLILQACEGCRALLNHVGQLTITQALSNGSLTEFDLSGERLGADDAAVLGCLLPRSASGLVSLSLCENPLKSRGGTYLAEGLQTLSLLTSLVLGSCLLDREGATAIATAFCGLSRLRHLYLSENNIQRDGALAIARMLPNLMALELINLESNAIRSDGAAAIVRGVAGKSTLRSLALASNDVGPADWCTILSPLMAQGVIGRDSGDRAVRINTVDVKPEMLAGKLLQLDLSASLVTDEACVALAFLPASAAMLESLSLGGGRWLAAEGMRAVAHGVFTALTALKRLALGSVDKQGLSVAVQLLPLLPQLCELSLAGATLGRDGASAVASAVAHLSGLRRLDLHGAMLGPDGGARLAHGLTRLKRLEELDAADCGLNLKGGLALAVAAARLGLLLVLDLTANGIEREGCTAIAQALAHATTLRELRLGHNGLAVEDEANVAAYLSNPEALIVPSEEAPLDAAQGSGADGEPATPTAPEEPAAQDTSSPLAVGDRVEAEYKNGSWYKASIAAVVVEDGGTVYVVDWDDGDTEDKRKTYGQIRRS